MEDKEIIMALMNGNHLNEQELERAKQLLNQLNKELETRVHINFTLK